MRRKRFDIPVPKIMTKIALIPEIMANIVLFRKIIVSIIPVHAIMKTYFTVCIYEL